MRVDVTDCDLREIVKAAYDMSSPQGMGHLHFDPAPLTEEEVDSVMKNFPVGGVLVSLDYVKGRSCKFHVHEDAKGRYIQSPWYDHTDQQFAELVSQIGATMPKAEDAEHGAACNCADCVSQRQA